MTKNEEQFVMYLLEGLSQRQAYLKAFPHSAKWKPGTVDTKACILYNSSKIQERLEVVRNRLVKELEDEGVITVKEILRDLAEVKDVCMARKTAPVALNGTVDECKLFNAAGANKALELLGKHLGMFDKREEDADTLAKLDKILEGIENAVSER